MWDIPKKFFLSGIGDTGNLIFFGFLGVIFQNVRRLRRHFCFFFVLTSVNTRRHAHVLRRGCATIVESSSGSTELGTTGFNRTELTRLNA